MTYPYRSPWTLKTYNLLMFRHFHNTNQREFLFYFFIFPFTLSERKFIKSTQPPQINQIMRHTGNGFCAVTCAHTYLSWLECHFSLQAPPPPPHRPSWKSQAYWFATVKFSQHFPLVARACMYGTKATMCTCKMYVCQYMHTKVSRTVFQFLLLARKAAAAASTTIIGWFRKFNSECF